MSTILPGSVVCIQSEHATTFVLVIDTFEHGYVRLLKKDSYTIELHLQKLINYYASLGFRWYVL